MAIAKTRGLGAMLIKWGPVAVKDGGNMDVAN